jgi:hypothetical protein
MPYHETEETIVGYARGGGDDNNGFTGPGMLLKAVPDRDGEWYSR